MDYSKIDDFEVDNIEPHDYPDFCNAYISQATITNDDGTTRDATDQEIEEMNEDSDFVRDCVEKWLY